MTKEDLVKCFSYEIPDNILNEIYENVQNNLNLFIKNEGIKYKKKIEINYRNPWNAYNNRYQYNACAKKIESSIYEIYICPLLIKDLYRFAFFVAGYKHFKISLEEFERQVFANHLMYFWLYFISLHEYSHIILGHIDYKKDKKQIFEFIDLTCLSEYELLESQAMEFEADSTATELFFNTIVNQKEEINKHFKNKLDDKELIHTYLLGLSFLFIFFDVRSDKNNIKTHPLGTERNLSFYSTIILKEKKFINKLNITKNEFLLEINKTLFDYLSFLRMDDKQIISLQLTFSKKMDILDKEKIRDRYKHLKLL